MSRYNLTINLSTVVKPPVCSFTMTFLVAIDKRHFVMLWLLDLSAVFNTVDHHILLTRLHSKYSLSAIGLITKMEECLSDIDKWMSINRLKLNKDKTELLYLFSKYNSQQSPLSLRFETDIIKPSSHARNIYWRYLRCHYVNASPSQNCL